MSRFNKDQIIGCWRLLETMPKGSRYAKALCIVCSKTIKEVEYSVLHRGSSKHCGCLSFTKNFAIGNTRNNFIITQLLPHPNLQISCLTCSTEKIIDKYRFLNKKTKCPTCNVSKKSQIKTGNKYEFLTTKAFIDKRNVECLCDCGDLVVVDYVALLNGGVKSCGCKTLSLRKETNLIRYNVESWSNSEEYVSKKSEIVDKILQKRHSKLVEDGIYSHCHECTQELTLYNESGYCTRCYKRVFWQQNYRLELPKCKKCGVDLQTNNTTGLCYDKCYRTKLSREYAFRKYHEDLEYKIALILRNRLSRLVKNGKVGSAVQDLGCTIEEFVSHIESLWDPEMNWNNYGKGKDKWNFDHITPLSSFNLTIREEFLKACHYKNIQPMWSLENSSKGAKLDYLRSME